jgi:hypothetical protein
MPNLRVTFRALSTDMRRMKFRHYARRTPISQIHYRLWEKPTCFNRMATAVRMYIHVCMCVCTYVCTYVLCAYASYCVSADRARKSRHTVGVSESSWASDVFVPSEFWFGNADTRIPYLVPLCCQHLIGHRRKRRRSVYIG